MFDVVIIGAGPIGLACAIECQKNGLDYVVVEKGCLTNSIYYFPQNMTFFSTTDLLEIGNVPFIISGDKPKRIDALNYYWRVCQHHHLNIRLYTRVTGIERNQDGYSVQTTDDVFSTKTVILATGYYDNPNLLRVPGEELPHVDHYFSHPHRYIHRKVVVIGANNSAVEAALELYRYGIDVSLVHRGKELGKGIKYWVLPDIQNRINRNEIPMMFQTTVQEIQSQKIVLQRNGERIVRSADSVLALTGYHPDFGFMKQIGICVDEETLIPQFNAQSGETNVSGVYIAGALQAGCNANKIFIENGRYHAPVIARVIAKKIGKTRA